MKTQNNKPWLNEPDELTGEFNGLRTLICRTNPKELGHLCGYVAVPDGHPLHGADCCDYDNSMIDEIVVHGGLTYSRDHAPGCESDGLWWLGFDCAHCDDLSPGLYERTGGLLGHGIYRDIEYVKKEVEQLAKQLAEMADRDAAV